MAMATTRNLSSYSPFLVLPTTTTAASPAMFQSNPNTSISIRALLTTPPASISHSRPQILNIPAKTNQLLYLEHSKHTQREPPRWFSPLDSFSSSRLPNSPLLLYLPGIGGSGLGLSSHHPRLGEMFDIWCLHIPATDRTPFPELVKLVESTVKSEHCQSPERPLYLVGQSFGACLALSVAARNPEIDILLVLANSATCFNGSQFRPLIPLLEAMPKELGASLHDMLNLITGMATQQRDTGLSEALVAMFSDLPGLAEVLSVETLVWKLKLLDSACSYTNSRLHAVKAQTLILSSGKDQLLPSRQEGQRLHRLLPKSDIRIFEDSGHVLFMEQDHDLVTTLKGTSFYRRTRNVDYVLDYLPPTPYEFQKARESHRFVEAAFSPVMLSTLENGKIVRGLSGIPSKDEGGMREALHRKGEEYQLFWPDQSEFVRMAAMFGAKIIPFGVVGEDDIGELIFDYEDQMKIPYLRQFIQELTDEAVQLRSNVEGEVGNQDVHFPVMRPKLPGRFYYLFGNPIETQGRQQELRNRDKAHELYVEVKSEVERCLSYLKEKRRNDPYRSILSRLVYQLTHGPESEIPTFEP
ncbi:unnamed protein product [Lactuca virosa]|uniref:AB hydrolase-1 domain-containing protein n=1 Tax=Lactuca virosa TaxID=75947 RepID=A0AAU9LY45_9ASTR|nr:unnamed protein product [Lactuca virosa]